MKISSTRQFADHLIPLLLAARGLVFRGTRHRCPVCGACVRAFCGPNGSFRRRESGYCPRCNSKSRHRFLMLLVEQGTVPPPIDPVLLVAPSYSELVAWRRERLVVLDNATHSTVDVVANLERLPFRSGTFRTVFCIHVLEHVDDDRSAIAELRRVVSPGGAVVVGVPFDGRIQTDEDPSVVDPDERRRRFGERDHRRAYGSDVAERIGAAGLQVTAAFSRDLDPTVAVQAGIRPDEVVLVAEVPG